MPFSSDTNDLRHPAGGAFRLALSASLLAIVWLILLPWLAARPAMHARIQWLDERRIDPSAMFYTELDSIDPILERLERRRK